MGFSLKGLITGIATSAGDIMDEERKQTNALIAQRTKNSFENYNKYQETTEALRADIKKRDAQLLNFQPDLNEEERIAAAGVPNLVEMYQQMLAQGKQVTVRDMIKVSGKAAGMKFDNYVTEIGKIAPTETAAAAPVSTKFFGPSAEYQRSQGEKAAMATGIPESELRGFERMPTTANVPSMGSINTEVFKKAPKQIGSVQEAMDLAAVDMYNIEKAEGKDNPKYREAKRLFDLAKTYIDAPVETLSKRADGLRIKLLDEKDDAKKEQLSAEIERTEQSIKAHALATSTAKEPDNKETYNAINTSVNAYVNNRMREMSGASWYKLLKFTSIPLPDGGVFVDKTSTEQMTPEEQQKVFAVERQLAKEALITNGFTSPTGVPLYNAVARIMNDRMIPVGQAPAPDATPAPSPAPTTPAAAQPAATATARPNAPPTTLVDKARNEAKAALATGADRAKVAARFKQITGQEL